MLHLFASLKCIFCTLGFFEISISIRLQSKNPNYFTFFFFFKMRSSVLSRDLFRLSSQTPTMNRESPIFDCNFNIFFIDLTFVGERI